MKNEIDLDDDCKLIIYGEILPGDEELVDIREQKIEFWRDGKLVKIIIEHLYINYKDGTIARPRPTIESP